MGAKTRRYRQRRSNPEAIPRAKAVVVDTAYQCGAAFAGYAANRILGRFVYSKAMARWPEAGKHVAVAASVAGVAGAYYLPEFWAPAKDYEDAVLLGAGVAAIQAVAQTYIPRYGWLVGDWQEPEASGLPVAGSLTAGGAAAAPAALPPASSEEALNKLLSDNGLEPVGDYADAADPDGLGSDLEAML